MHTIFCLRYGDRREKRRGREKGGEGRGNERERNEGYINCELGNIQSQFFLNLC
jgi:hypothetical protein